MLILPLLLSPSQFLIGGIIEAPNILDE
jgi:hypothetical protein